MAGNRFKELIKSGKYCMGLSTYIQDPAIAELCAYAGFDWIFCRMHDKFETFIRGADAAGIPVIVNIPGGSRDPALIARALDSGAAGVQFALVESGEEAERIVEMCKLGPIGEREAFPGGRLGRYWGMTMNEFTERANDAAILVKIENKTGLDNYKEILSVPGIDMICVGPSDVSRSLGIPRFSPLIMEWTHKVWDFGRTKGITPLKGVLTADELGQWVRDEKDIRFFFLATDGTQIGYHFRNLLGNCHKSIAEIAKSRGIDVAAVPVGPGLTPWMDVKGAKK